MDNDCRKKPPSRLLEGIGQFNRGDYYDCHETLEEIWMHERGKIRDLYKGILQIGVAIYHAKRSNLKGALRLVSSGMELLSPFAPECMGVDVAHLLQSAGRFREELNELASDPGLSLRAIPVIRFFRTFILIIMGPMGCGKTTVGRLLAARLGWPFIDADDFHPGKNLEKMRTGIALNDEDRYPWLERLRDEIQDRLREKQSTILACSALKKAYRDLMGVDQTTIVTVYLKGSPELLHQRVMMRQHPYMSRDLLQSQLSALEEPHGGLWVDIAPSPDEIVRAIMESLEITP